jgi:ABC-type Fe3+/spermidine/putrescine transport system ATPase subunit
MFQDFALFPHMNVYDNVAFGLRTQRWSDERVAVRVLEVLELVGLPGFDRRDVNTLSGGEAQRVALARSLAPSPRLLMLDEPLGSLDRALRERLVLELGDILRSTHQTAIYVTHDQEEAYALADRVAVMNAGRLEQLGTPQAIYTHPSTPFVARFLGMTNLLMGMVHEIDGGYVARTSLGDLPVERRYDGEVTVLLRPDAAYLGDRGAVYLDGKLVSCSYRGGFYRAGVEVNGISLVFDFASGSRLPAIGEPIRLYFEPAEALRVFEQGAG